MSYETQTGSQTAVATCSDYFGGGERGGLYLSIHVPTLWLHNLNYIIEVSQTRVLQLKCRSKWKVKICIL